MENTEADVCCSSELWRKDRTSDECYYQNSTYLWTERWSLPKLNRGVGLRLSAACRSVPGALPGLLNPHWHLVNGGLRWDNDSLTPSRLIETTTLVNTSQGPEALSSCVLDDWQPTPASSLIILRLQRFVRISVHTSLQNGRSVQRRWRLAPQLITRLRSAISTLELLIMLQSTGCRNCRC